jgi:hypothetical protein
MTGIPVGFEVVTVDSGCLSCSFDYESVCAHPSFGHKGRDNCAYERSPPPDWCPLRKRPTLVVLNLCERDGK